MKQAFLHQLFLKAFIVFSLVSSQHLYALDLGVSLDYSKGGDTLVNVQNDNNFLIGDGITMGLVARQNLFAGFQLRSSVAYKYKAETYIAQGTTPQGDVAFTSLPVTLGLKYAITKKVAVEFGTIKYLNGDIADLRTNQNFTVTSNNALYSEFIIGTRKNKHFELGLRYVSNLNFLIVHQGVNYNYNGDHFSFIARNYF